MRSIKQVSFIIVLVAMVLFTPLDSSAQSFYNGNELVQMMREYEKDGSDPSKKWLDVGIYMGYVAGIYDVMKDFHDVQENVTAGQVFSTVGKYLKENPENWALSASFLVSECLRKAFPLR